MGHIQERSRSIVLFAFQSRIFIFILQFFFNYLIPDHNAGAFNPGSFKNGTVLDKIASHIFDGLSARWDGIYFMHIAEYGYTYENTLVFFPLFPLLTRLLTQSLFFPLHFIICFRNVLHFAAILINVAAFLTSAYYLYKLGCTVIGQEHIAYRAAQLFCVNPASVFFSAAYSESLFSALTFAALLNLNENKYFKASILFAFSGATRSNGIINAGFIIYFYLIKWYKRISTESMESYTCKSNKWCGKLIFGFFEGIKELLLLFFLVFVSVSLFLSHQAYCYLIFCHDMRYEFQKAISENLVKYGTIQGYNMPGYGPVPSWCNNKFPLSYSKIQEKHWNIGLFRYYELNQLPNFLLAFPMLAISMTLCMSYFIQKPLYCILLGMQQGFKKKNHLPKIDSLVFFYQDTFYVYVAQLGMLVIFGTMYMHIQVITRMICSSCPVFYWYLGERCMTEEERITANIMHQRLHLNSSKENIRCVMCIASKSSSSEIQTFSPATIRSRCHHTKKKNKEQLNQFWTENMQCTKLLRHRKEHSRLSNKCFELSNNIGYDKLIRTFEESEVIDWNEGIFNKLISIYFHSYSFVGVAAFSNFFPWT